MSKPEFETHIDTVEQMFDYTIRILMEMSVSYQTRRKDNSDFTAQYYTKLLEQILDLFDKTTL